MYTEILKDLNSMIATLGPAQSIPVYKSEEAMIEANEKLLDQEAKYKLRQRKTLQQQPPVLFSVKAAETAKSSVDPTPKAPLISASAPKALAAQAATPVVSDKLTLASRDEAIGESVPKVATPLTLASIAEAIGDGTDEFYAMAYQAKISPAFSDARSSGTSDGLIFGLEDLIGSRASRAAAEEAKYLSSRENSNAHETSDEDEPSVMGDLRSKQEMIIQKLSIMRDNIQNEYAAISTRSPAATVSYLKPEQDADSANFFKDLHELRKTIIASIPANKNASRGDIDSFSSKCLESIAKLSKYNTQLTRHLQEPVPLPSLEEAPPRSNEKCKTPYCSII